MHHVAPYTATIILVLERKKEMQQEVAVAQAKTSELSPKMMECQELRRRACTDETSQELEKLVITSSTSNNPRLDAATTTTNNKASSTAPEQQVVETVRCACCGVAEDCTAAYIRLVRASFCGDWLCGLCAEAVKEAVRRDPAVDTAVALGLHEAECRDFNATTRLNPMLSLAGSMRRIARRSFDRRVASFQLERRGGEAEAAAALARSASCDPWLLAEVVKGPAGDRCR